MADTEYETFKQMPIEDLARRAAGGGTGSSLEMAKFVYGEQFNNILCY
jgi:hypothetical protein